MIQVPHPQTLQVDLLRHLAPSARSYLEVGVQEGLSLIAVCEANRALERIVLCDTWGSDSGGTGRGSNAHIAAMLPMLTPARVQFLDGDSRVMLPALTASFDLVHIDGGHDYPVALSDLREGWRVCVSTMIVHDISFPGVWAALWELGQTLTHAHTELYFGGHGTAVIRRAQ
jgi:hypothetical protein